MNSFEEAFKALNSEDEEVRLQALRSLAGGDPEQILPPVFKSFGDDSWRVRKEAIGLFLGLPMRRELIGDVVELLHAEENAGLRNAAVEILVKMGREAIPMLLSRIDCPDHDVRKFIVDILGEIGDPQAVPALVNALNDDDNNVLAAAAENLGKLKAAEAVPTLLDAMQNPDVLLRFTILEALGKIDQPIPLARLAPFRDEKLLRKALIDCLGRVGDSSAISEVVTGLSDPMRNVRKEALLALMNLDQRYPESVRETLVAHDLSSTVDAVAQFLDDGQPKEVRVAALRVLGWLGAGAAVEQMLSFLDLETLQHDALRALADIGAAKPEVLVAAWADISSSHKPYLAYVLGEAGCHEALPLLREALDDQDPKLRQMAVHALGQLGCVEAVVDLVSRLGDKEAAVQAAASQSLIGLGAHFPAETFTALQQPLEEGDQLQRKFAVDALGNIDHPEVPVQLGKAMKDPDPEVRRAAIKAFEGRGTEVPVHNILLALTDEDGEVRRTAVAILAASGQPEALDGLKLALSDEDIWVRSAAVRALGHLGGQAVAAKIAEVTQDPDGLVSIAALETLFDILGEEACPYFVGVLGHADEEVVSASLNLLSRCSRTDWLMDHAETLINHSFWAVRTHFARFASSLLGQDARPLLEKRLEIETEDLVRQQLIDALQSLTDSEV